MISPAGFGVQPFGTSPFGAGYRDLIVTFGPTAARGLEAGAPAARVLAAGRMRTRTLTARLEAR